MTFLPSGKEEQEDTHPMLTPKFQDHCHTDIDISNHSLGRLGTYISAAELLVPYLKSYFFSERKAKDISVEV
jgi:hypothetical protein